MDCFSEKSQSVTSVLEIKDRKTVRVFAKSKIKRANIIVIWTQSKGGIAISATVLELVFAGLTMVEALKGVE